MPAVLAAVSTLVAAVSAMVSSGTPSSSQGTSSAAAAAAAAVGGSDSMLLLTLLFEVPSVTADAAVAAPTADAGPLLSLPDSANPNILTLRLL
jgi:hypothetical protein